MSTLKEWLIDNQENGDDGTGHCDYKQIDCEDCRVVCGDCLYPISKCGGCAS